MGCFLLSKYQYPDLEFEDLNRSLEDISREVWLELNDDLTALEKVKVLNQVMYGIKRFSGNYANFYSPHNNYINSVIENRKGNPISLSIIYSLLAQKVKLPIFGVNLPKNFILVYKDELKSFETYDRDLDDHILFYINPYNRGAVLGKSELEYFLKQQNIESRKEYFLPCTNLEIVNRLLNNLIFAYNKQGLVSIVKDLEELSAVLQ
jgi:regulator of sirC expression with transglutaminase-like and TPR domain